MPPVTGMSLAELIQSRQIGEDEVLTTTLNFLGIFTLTLTHISKERFRSMLRRAKKITYVEHQKLELDDDEKMAELVSEHVVGWEGLTVRKVSRMFWLRIDDLSEEQKEEKVVYSAEGARTLLVNNEMLYRTVLNSALSAANFSEALEGAEKNLPSGPVTGPAPAE